MIERFIEFATSALDQAVISCLYLEQRPGKLAFVPLALTSEQKDGEPKRKVLPSSFFCAGKNNGHFLLKPRSERGECHIFDFSFPSHMPSNHEENDRVKGRLYLFPHPAPCVLFLHGWRMRTYLSLRHLLRPYLQAGYHAAFMELPFHYSRAPKGTFSGEKMIQPSMTTTLRNIRQAVCDVRDTVTYLSSIPAVTSLVLAGVSLGGWIAALACTAEDQLGAAVLISPPVDPEKMYYKSDVIKVLKKGMKNLDGYFESHKKILMFCRPAAYPPLIDPRKILIVEAIYDRFVPREIIEELWKAWQKPPILRYPHGHISIMLDPKVTEGILTHLRENLTTVA